MIAYNRYKSNRGENISCRISNVTLLFFANDVIISMLIEVFLVLSTNKQTALDDFKLFYEELPSSKQIRRIRRTRSQKT